MPIHASRFSDARLARASNARPVRPELRGLLFLVALLVSLAGAFAQQPAEPPIAEDEAIGRPVAEVRVVGNRTISTTEILNNIRTSIGDPFDPRVVSEDYQRLYNLRHFRRVEARYLNAPEGVVVVFDVEEQPIAQALQFRGNRQFTDETLREIVEFEAGRSLDPVMLAFAQSAIERMYLERNYSFVEVRILRDEEIGTVTFDITEGPRVFVRNVRFLGAESFTAGQLRAEIGTRHRWLIPILGRRGLYDPRQIDEDVGALQRFYRQRGFFDARVGRRIVVSPDMSEVQVDFLIDEGPRYRINEIRFEGNRTLSDEQLRQAISMSPGDFYDQGKVELARREMVRVYSPFGFIHALPVGPIEPSPDYLIIVERPLFELEPGRMDLVFRINEGRPFRVGNLEVRGNVKTQDKVILRQFDLAPGEVYDSDAVERGTLRLRALGYFSRVAVSPIGDDPETRDLLIEIEEQSTAMLTVGGAVTSNGGLSASLRYEQRNFDILDFPERPGDVFRGDAFVGAGQNFLISLEPGTITSNAAITFYEPYLFDQNVGFRSGVYWRTSRRREYQDRRAGGRLTLSPRVGRNFRTGISVRGEDVHIFDIREPLEDRAPEILAGRGHDLLTSVGLEVGYDWIDNPLLPSRGVRVSTGWESLGALGGDVHFQRITGSLNTYLPLYRDDAERPVVLETRLDAGYLFNDAPFYERFYGGGMGSVRGFRFRGISPRDGLADDPIGGDFSLTGSIGIGFPLVGDTLRGVIFTDAGLVESRPEFGTIRTSAGFGFRLNLDMLGNIPIALDFAWPLNRADEDDLQVWSFSLGFLQ